MDLIYVKKRELTVNNRGSQEFIWCNWKATSCFINSYSCV